MLSRQIRGAWWNRRVPVKVRTTTFQSDGTVEYCEQRLQNHQQDGCHVAGDSVFHQSDLLAGTSSLVYP